MRLVINARFLTQPISGVQRYARELLTAFDRRLSGDATLAARFGPAVAFYPAGQPLIQPPDWRHIRIVPTAGGSGHYWEQVTLARASRGKLLVSLCGAGPLLHKDQLLIIHDANVFDLTDAFSWRYRVFHRTMRRQLARRVAVLGTVSNAASNALHPHLRVPRAQFAVIPNSADHILSVAADNGALTRFGLKPGSYLLTVGNQSPNKNIARLVAAHASLRDRPVLAVAGGFAPGLSAQPVAETPGLRLLGRVSDAELRALYEGTSAFVWPARSEGFGIPPLEAMALGVPVLSSSSSAMPEVLGDAPLYFDPNDTDDIAKKLDAVRMMTTSERNGMIEKGRKRAAFYNWDNSAECLIAALDRAAARISFENTPRRAARPRPIPHPGRSVRRPES